MNVETFIDKVMEIATDSEIERELEKGLKIQFTIGREKTKIVALKPKITREHSEKQNHQKC